MPQNLSPTPSELKILRVIWQRGPSTVREVHQRIAGGESLSYTTVLKQLQIMTEKGLVRRDTGQRAHVYVAVNGERETQQELLGEFVSRVYGGSSSRMVMQALGLSRPASRQELDRIDALVRELRTELGNGEHGETGQGNADDI